MVVDCNEGQIPPKKVHFFHSLPHVNFNFNNISSTFKPTDKDYQQDLLIYSSVPVIIGAVFFIIFAVYFLVYCCSYCCRKPIPVPKRKNRTKCAACLALCIWICALISCGSIISGFVFNDDIDSGVAIVTKAMQNVTNTFGNIHSEVGNVQDNILDMKENIVRMIGLPGIPRLVRDDLQEIKSLIMEIIAEVNGVKKQNAPDISGYVKTGEFYRWWATFGVFGLGIITCLFAVYSSIRRSRCGFCLALLLGCVVFLLDWVIIGSHLGAAIGMSDLCVDPRKTINFYLKTSSLITKEIVNYYLDCKPGSRHPYERYIDSSFVRILTADEFVKAIAHQGWLPQKDINQLTTDLDDTESSLTQIRNNLKCTTIKKDYHKAQCAVCFPIVGRISWLLVVSCVIIISLAAMLLLVIPMCERIRRKKKRTFVNSMLNGVEPSLETQYHSVTSDEESMPLMPSYSPPPYEATSRSVDYQFHSCQEDRNYANSTAQQQQFYQPDGDTTNSPQNNFAPPPLRGQVDPIQRKDTIAF